MDRMQELENMWREPLDDDYRPYNPPPFWDKREDDWQAERRQDMSQFRAVVAGLVLVWAVIGVSVWVWL